MLLLSSTNSMCSQAFGQASTTACVDNSSVHPCLRLQETCISVTKSSRETWKCYIHLQNKHRSYKLPPLLSYFLWLLEVLGTAYPLYFLFRVISKLISTMVLLFADKSKGRVLESEDAPSALYKSLGEDSKVAFLFGEKAF